MTTIEDIQQAIADLALAGKTLFIHGSIKSFGHLEGGAASLFDPLIAADCTLIMPSFTYSPLANPPSSWQFAGNGHRGEWDFFTPEPFDVQGNDIEPSMGALPKALLHYPNRERSQHPINSFVGVGPHAAEILQRQTLQNVYGLYENQPQAWVLTLGVDLTSVTPIHYGEQLSGRELFQRWAQQINPHTGQVETVLAAIGSCSNGFNNLAPVLAPIAREYTVGASLWTLYPLEPLVKRCKRAISAQQSITHCPDRNCIRCQDAIASAG
ncbi:AAC(3) family N-acetyltransferase [Motilimonas sp. E26]|uniref:AAC(3) family N-acetyltransferase n=1 Tax=Motilimonas sp. E26 TaxID=2865674 RepID=UPI001E649DA0|nr:AAC(3) family N-acetyltransferase [Motilimonas sp. E26]MCE0558887.1 AAC(3) family N-acetyltransferase [Motilimonas sp. E26]